MLGDLTANYNGIPRSYYRFGASWPHVRETLLVIQEQDGDPFAVMMPTTEIIRFYYAPSTRLAQALFWGEYGETFNAERSSIPAAVRSQACNRQLQSAASANE